MDKCRRRRIAQKRRRSPSQQKRRTLGLRQTGPEFLADCPHPSNCRTPIDVLVESELERSGLTLGPPAEPHQLLRRVTFTLTGLPPDVDQLENYLNDLRPDAYDRLIDSVLASPQFGVRWGEHWLDVAGYADSNGYFNADSDRPLAYRYRDYVIRSINCDNPSINLSENSLRVMSWRSLAPIDTRQRQPNK